MAAGNWLTSAGIGDANIAVARRTISAALNAAEKNNEVLGHPVIRDILARDEVIGAMLGELGVSESLLTIGQSKLIASVEGNDDAAIAFSTANTPTITPARHAHARVASDFARAVQEPLLQGELSPNVYGILYYDGLMAWVNTFVSKLVTLFASLTNEIGTTATDLTWSAVQHGVIDFKDRGNVGPAIGFLDAVGAKDLMDDTLSLGGAVQWAPQAQNAIQNVSSGARLGTFWGADFYLSGEVTDDATDAFGGLIGMGCLQTKHKRVPLPSEAIQIVDGGWWTMEARRVGGSTSRYDIVSHLAAQIREQGRGSMIRYGVT